MEDLVQRARHFAVEVHRRIDHRRKYTQQPYEVHLKAVAETVSSVTDDPEVIAAAWLHDTVEDTPATLEDIEREFGPRVTSLVSDLTDVSKPGDGNRAVRKAIDREHLAKGSPEAKTVKLADLIDNCRDICKFNPGFARIFVGEVQALLEVLQEGDARLLKRARRAVDDCLAALARPTRESERGPSETPAPASFPHSRASRLFTESFTAEDIAEPLRWFDGDRPARDVAAAMEEQQLTLAGLRHQGRPVGFVQRQDLQEGACWPFLREFAPSQVLDGEASFSDVIQVLTRHDRCFVSLLGEVTGTVTRADIQKPVVRMWLFGIVTLIEIMALERIRACWLDESWRSQISEARLSMARELQAERQRRGQSCDLLDCLQLSDKARILMTDPQQRREFGFESKAQADRAVQDLESLRNSLAHAQDIVTHDWPQVVRLAHRIEEMAHRGH